MYQKVTTLLLASLAIVQVQSQYPFFGHGYSGAPRTYGHDQYQQSVQQNANYGPLNGFFHQAQASQQVPTLTQQYMSPYQRNVPSIPSNFFGHGPIGGHNNNVPVPKPQSGCSSSGQTQKVDYGECPQLEATSEEKMKKEEKQKECLTDLEVNENSTLTDLSEAYQSKVKECVLRKDELVSFWYFN